MRYKAFISYSHKDEASAARLHRRLETYRPPRGLTLSDGSAPDRLYPIYRDRDEMPASHSLPGVIEAALDASDWLIVLCSPASAKSAWVAEEIRLFAKLHGAERILPAIVDGQPPDCFPPALQDDLEEPLAPDLRAGKDGFDDGALKIIAGIWGVSLGLLKNREEARRRRRARIGAALAAVFAGLAVFAGFSVWRAAEQEARAEAEARMVEARSLATLARATFEENPGETSVAAMIAVQSLSLGATPEAAGLLREALDLAPLGAAPSPFPWRWPQVGLSRDGRIAAFMSAMSSDAAPARSELVRLSPGLDVRERIAFDGLAEPALSPDGRWLAVGGRVRRLLVRDLKTGETALDQPVDSGLAAAFSSADGALYAATQLGDVLRWREGDEHAQPAANTPASGLRLPLPQLGLSTAGDWMLRAENGRPTILHPLPGGRARAVPFSGSYQKINWREHAPAGVVAHPDGDRFIAYDTFNTGALWNAEAMTTVWEFDDRSRVWSDQKANVISIDGSLYARGRGDGDISVRNVADGAVVHRSDHAGQVRAVAVLDQPRRIVAAGEGGVSIWPLGAKAPMARCAGESDILALSIETAGTILAGAADGRLIRCDGGTGAVLAERSFGAPIASIAEAKGEIVIALKLGDREDTWTELGFANVETGAMFRRSINVAFDQLRLSADGSRAATRSWAAGDVVVWDTATGDLVSRFAAKGDLIGLTPNGGRVLMDYRALDMFDVQTGARLRQFGEAGGVTSLIASPYAEDLIAYGEADEGKVTLGWNTGTGRRSWRITGNVELSQGGDVYAERSVDELRWTVMDRPSGNVLGDIPFEGDAWGASLSPDGASIALSRRLSGSNGFETELWDVRAGRMIWRKTTGAPNAPPPRVAGLSRDRAALIFGRRDDDGNLSGRIDVFDWTSGDVFVSTPWSGAGVATVQADMAGRVAVISTSEGTLLLRLTDGARIWSTPATYDRGFAFSPDGAVLIAGRPGPAGDVILALSGEDGGVLWQAPSDHRIQDLGVSADGSHAIAALSSDGWRGVRSWRLAGGARAHDIPLDAAPRQIHPLADPDRLVVRDAAGAVRLLNLSTGAEIRRLAMAIRADRGAFSADGARAVTAAGTRLRVWNVDTGDEIDTLTTKGRLTALAISPDGGEVAYVDQRNRPSGGGGALRRASIWRPGSDTPADALALNDPRRLAYDPTGEMLAIASGDDRLHIVDAGTLAPRFTVSPLANGVFSTSSDGAHLFTGDGAHLIVRETGSYGQGNTSERRTALRVFDVADGKEVARLDAGLFVRATAAAPSGFYYADPEGRARYLEIGADPLDRRLDAPADDMLAVPNSDLILTSGYWRGAALIDIQTGARVDLTDKQENRHILDSAVDRTGRFAALSLFDEGEDGGDPTYELLVFDTASGDLLARTPPSSLDLRHIEFAEGGEAIIAAQYAEHSLITNASERGGLYIWRWRSGSLTPLIEDNPVADFVVSGDGAWLATSEGGKSRDTGAQYGSIQTRLIRIGDGAVQAVRPHDFQSPNLAVSPSGDRLGVFSAASPTSGEIRPIASGDPSDVLLSITLDDVAFYGRPLGFLDEGRTFALGERSGARVYDLETGAVRRLRTPWRARSYALSADGAFIAIGGEEDISIWRLRAPERLADVKVPDLRAILFAGGDMKSLIAATDDGVFRLEWDHETLVRTACRAYRNDDWEKGRRRIASTDAAGLCAEKD